MRVHEYEMKTGITRTPEFERKKLASFAVNVGLKCGHFCTYCSSSALLRRHPAFKALGENPFAQGYCIVDPVTPHRVARDAARMHDRGLVQLCTLTDAWSPEAQRHNLGRRCLQALRSQPDWSVRILTKNAAVRNDFDLIGQKEHMAVMKGSLAPSTLHIHGAALSLLAESVGWDQDLAQISARDIERFRSTRLATGITPSSANKELRALKRVFNLPALRGYIVQGSNPCAAVPMVRVGRKRLPYCSSEDFAALYRVVPDPLWRAFLVLLYATGLRLDEALNLTWADVDFSAAQLHVTRKVATQWIQAWNPKDHERQTVPLAPQAVNLLNAWQSVAPEKCPYVFMDQGRWDYYRQQVVQGRWLPGQDLVNNLLRRFKTLCHKAGIGRYTLHDLRRSCITNWAQRLPIHVVQQLAGHSDIKTTQQYYLSVQPEDVAKAQSVQESMLKSIAATATPTDPKLTHSARKRHSLGQRLSKGLSQTKAGTKVGKRTLQDSNLQPTAP